MIIGISGYAGSGKDTIGKMIVDKTKSFTIEKFAKKLKQMASIMTGIPVEKFEDHAFKESFMSDEWSYKQGSFVKQMTVRKFLQRLGTDAVRYGLHKDAWVNALFQDYNEGDNWVITDTRFPNEAERIKQYEGIIIRVNNTPPGVSTEFMSETETSLDKYEFDYVIDNFGTLEQLEKKVNKILLDIIAEKV